MTEFENTYRHLVSIGPPLRRQWLVDHRPPTVSSAHWWLALIEAAAGDVRGRHRGWPVTRPSADLALAASLIEWALEQGLPPELAIGRLVELTTMALAAGDKIEHLPVGIRPDSIARQAINGFAMTASLDPFPADISSPPRQNPPGPRAG